MTIPRISTAAYKTMAFIALILAFVFVALALYTEIQEVKNRPGWDGFQEQKQQPQPQQQQPKPDSVILVITAGQEAMFNIIDQQQLLINREKEYLFLDVLKANKLKRADVEGKRVVTKKVD